jgi:hypothetical protein
MAGNYIHVSSSRSAVGVMQATQDRDSVHRPRWADIDLLSMITLIFQCCDQRN